MRTVIADMPCAPPARAVPRAADGGATVHCEIEAASVKITLTPTRRRGASPRAMSPLLLLATETPNNTRLHFHLDHLGTPRLVTNQSGTTVGQHDYYPFGTETASSVQESARGNQIRRT